MLMNIGNTDELDCTLASLKYNVRVFQSEYSAM